MKRSRWLPCCRRGNSPTASFARGLTERFPERALGWKTLGALLFASGCAQDAVAAMQEAIRTAPQDAETHKNLGTVFNKLDRLDEAERSLRSALQIAPQYAAAHSHLASTYQLQGRFAEAEACYRRAISLPAQDLPDDSYTGLLFMLSHNPDIGADALFAEHLKIGERIAAAAPASRPRHANIPDPERRLQVGFVSGDLCRHPIANFIEPILAQLRDRPGLELHVYHVNAAEDEVSARLRGYVRHWHAVRSLSPAQLADRIESDGIDVLIDLSGHTSLNRLRTFARKPAPIQASWMGYPGTTGLRAMDYYLSDRHFLPPGRFDRYFTEKLVYLPALAPFQPYAAAPPVNPLPALGTGHITFGSFNRLGKITAATLRLWARLLIAIARQPHAARRSAGQGAGHAHRDVCCARHHRRAADVSSALRHGAIPGASPSCGPVPRHPSVQRRDHDHACGVDGGTHAHVGRIDAAVAGRGGDTRTIGSAGFHRRDRGALRGLRACIGPPIWGSWPTCEAGCVRV